MRLNIGAGQTRLEGFDPLDIKNGQDARSLAYIKEPIEEIYASHVLEHFGHTEVFAVLCEWVKALQPGGWIRLAVPDFLKISQAYLSGERINIQGYLMGGQMDGDDYHKTLFDEECLREMMTMAGLVDIQRWSSELGDCSSLPISLNLMGRKPLAAQMPIPKVGVVMSVPRVGWMDNFFSCYASLSGFGFPIMRNIGVFWGQCLTRSIEILMREHPDLEAILTVDYDTIFRREDVKGLLALLIAHPEAAAIAPLQSRRSGLAPLLTVANGQTEVRREAFDAEMVEVNTAHFGLTLLRTSALRAMPKPWFCEFPDEGGSWGPNKIDSDIHFWGQLKRAGLKAYITPKVVVGHIETVIGWPDQNLEKVWQDSAEYFDKGKPKEIWR